MNLKKSGYSNIISCLVAFTVCIQNPIWPFWYKGIGMWIGYITVFSIFLLMFKKRYFVVQIKDLLVLPLSILSFIIIPAFNGFRLSSIFILLAFYVALNIREIELRNSFNYITKYLYFVILISLPAWLINMYVYELPVFGELDLSEAKGGALYIYNNYLLFVTDAFRDYFRFYSVFDEPGTLGTFAAFVLYGNRYDFKKKENVVILIGALFTYSMAFYMLTSIGWVYQSSKSIERMLLSIVSISCIAVILVNILADDLAFRMSVLDRFTDVGLNNVENRTGEYVNMFWERYIRSTDFIFGMGISYIENNFFDFGNSYKRFAIQYGLFGLVVLFFMYVCLIRKWNRYTMGALMLFVLSFLQRPFAFTAWQILLFSAIISCSVSNTNRKIVN